MTPAKSKPQAARRSAPRRKATTARRATGTSTMKRCSVTFSVVAPDAQRVDVSGSFNEWGLKPLKKGKNGTWRANLRPRPGRYEYKFLVDHQWITDPNNTATTTDENGNVNSVIELS